MGFLNFSIDALSLGCLYALSAMGFVILFKTGRIINFAHGELMVAGALIFLFFYGRSGMPLFWAFILTLLIGACLGLIIELLFIRPLTPGNITHGILMTLGIALMIKGALTFPGSEAAYFNKNEIIKASNHIMILIAGAVSIALFLWFIRRSSAGIKIRAVSDSRKAALSIGISLKNISSISWVVAGTAASISGILLAMLNGQNMDGLGAIELRIFPVIILGGLSSIRGVLIGGLVIGFLETLVAGHVSESMMNMFSYLIIILILFLRPYGLFAARGDSAGTRE